MNDDKDAEDEDEDKDSAARPGSKSTEERGERGTGLGEGGGGRHTKAATLSFPPSKGGNSYRNSHVVPSAVRKVY